MEEVCPDAWFLNYVNPMAMLTGYMQRYTGIKTVGLCHSVQVCSEMLLKSLDMEQTGFSDKIAGINHMAWLLEIKDSKGNDLYPEIRKRAAEKILPRNILIWYGLSTSAGWAITVRNPASIIQNITCSLSNQKYPELIEKYNIPLDEYPRRCVKQIEDWETRHDSLIQNPELTHERTREYASYIMESMVLNQPYKIGGNILNNGVIENLPRDACVEVPCLVDGSGIKPCYMGRLPVQLAAMNMTNINVQLLTIEAAVTKNENIFIRPQ